MSSSFSHLLNDAPGSKTGLMMGVAVGWRGQGQPDAEATVWKQWRGPSGGGASCDISVTVGGLWHGSWEGLGGVLTDKGTESFI